MPGTRRPGRRGACRGHRLNAIVVADLRVSRGGRPVLSGISLSIPGGEVTGLLGPSGCGKSTLLRSIVGVQRVAGGTVTVLGEPAGTPSLRRRVGYMTQSPAVYADLTIRENVRYFAAVLEARGRVEEAIETVRLASLADRLVRDLSGGERSRCSLAVALVGAPEVLVLDEPTVGLDPVLRRELWSTFHRLADAGTSVLISTHVMDEADRCDHLLLMREGRILAAGTPDALRAEAEAGSLEEAFLRLASAS